MNKMPQRQERVTMLVIEGSRGMKTPNVLNQLEAYWEALRPEQGLPGRDDINPRGLESVLDFSFLIEKTATGDVVFRLAGEKLGQLLGVALDKIPVSVLFARDTQPQLRKALKSVFEVPSILRAEAVSAASMMRPELHAHLIVLPLRFSENDRPIALGALYYTGDVGKSPRQFTHFHHNLTRIILETPLPQQSVPIPAKGMAEGETSFAHKKGRPQPEGRPLLKVIKGGLS